MTDANARRHAMRIAAELPPDPKARRQIMDYLNALAPFLDGEADRPQAKKATAT